VRCGGHIVKQTCASVNNALCILCVYYVRSRQSRWVEAVSLYLSKVGKVVQNLITIVSNQKSISEESYTLVFKCH
jgi:hypothetical protein